MQNSTEANSNNSSKDQMQICVEQNNKTYVREPSSRSYIQEPNYFADIIINTQIAKYISSFDPAKGISMNNVILLMTLFSIGELKGLFKILYRELGSLIKDNYKDVFSKIYGGGRYFINGLHRAFVWLKTPNITLNEPRNLEMVKSTKNVAYYNINTMVEFVQGLVNIINKKNDEIYANYTVSNEVQIDFQNMENEIINELWSDIYIEFEKASIRLNNVLKLSFLNNREKKLISATSIKKCNENLNQNLNSEKIYYVHQLIDDPVISGFLECIYMEYMCTGDGFFMILIKIIKQIYQLIRII